MKISELEQALLKWEVELRKDELSENTIRLYKTALTQLLNFLKKKNLEYLNKNSILLFKDYLVEKRNSGKIKTSTINSRIIGINRFLTDHNLESLKLKVERIQHKFVLENELTLEEAISLIQTASELGYIRESIILKTILKTGIRFGELAGFTVEALKEASHTGFISIINKKKERVIFISNELSNELLEYAHNNGIKKGFIFPNTKGTGIVDRGNLSKRIKYIGTTYCDIKEEKLFFHNLRHIFARTYMQIPGANIYILADLLGHANINASRIYCHNDVETNREIIETLFTDI